MTGIGYRKDFADIFLKEPELELDFVEVAPENWMGIGGFWKKQFLQVIEKYPLFTHGLSLSLGSPDELDLNFLQKVKRFLKETNAVLYSEHLSYASCDNAHLYDLLPIPFTYDAVKHVARKIRQVQDFLERRIAIELVSYYSPVSPEMSESQFICSVLEEADCDLLLDVNNVYVNAFNHRYDAPSFLRSLPMDRVRYIHMAGHEKVSDDLIIDTHGEPIIDPVYELFGYTLALLGRDVPVLLERDFNIPEMRELQQELSRLKNIKSSILSAPIHATA